MQTVKSGNRGQGAGGRGNINDKNCTLHAARCTLYTFFCLIIALFIASCAPKKPPLVRKNKTFFYSHYYFQNKHESEVFQKNIFTPFWDRDIYGLLYDYRINMSLDAETTNVWGKPFAFKVTGRDKTAAFNAWAWMVSWLMGEKTAIKGSLELFFGNRELSRFRMLKGKAYYDATNDAVMAAYFLLTQEDVLGIYGPAIKKLKSEGELKLTQSQKIELKKLSEEEKQRNLMFTEKTYDSLSSLIDDSGHLSCCMIDGKVYNEMYSRHGLVIASLVYAYKILGKELYAEKAKKLADYFIAHNYHKEGYFDNWISIGTDSEICTGLLEVYDITGDKKYLQICEQVANYYDSPHAKMTHNPQGHKDLRHDQHIYSAVDQAEFVILLKNLYAFTKNKHYLDMARGILKDLQMCYDPKWKLYSHMCYWNGKHDDHFFAVIQAIIYIAML